MAGAECATLLKVGLALAIASRSRWFNSVCYCYSVARKVDDEATRNWASEYGSSRNVGRWRAVYDGMASGWMILKPVAYPELFHDDGCLRTGPHDMPSW